MAIITLIIVALVSSGAVFVVMWWMQAEGQVAERMISTDDTIPTAKKP